ncbi:MAG: SCO family protein [Pyrinomonadaceae bacterium]
MSTNKALKQLTAVILLICVLTSFSSCRRHSSTEKRYDLKGKVLAVEKDKHLITVAHEDIKDFMPAMTMPFTLRDDWAYEILTTGDQITATLVVDGTQSWLENIVITKESTDTSATSSAGGGEAKAGDQVPDYGLVNQNGLAIHIGQYRGKAVVLTFIYTRCPIPDYCTLMSNNLAQIDQELQKQPELYEKTHLLSVSIDPEYDTPAVLRSYGSAHTGKYSDETFAHWEFASGTKDQVKGIAQYFGLRYYHDTSSGQEQIIHGLRTIVIAPDGKVAKVYRGNEWKPAEVLGDLHTILQ